MMNALLTPFKMLADAVLPPRCPISGEIVPLPGVLSVAEWTKLTFITNPLCDACGTPLPFEIAGGEGLHCGLCTKTPPVYGRARAALRYDDLSRDLILAFKHGDKTEILPCFIPWLKQAGREILTGADVLIPVPLHHRRLIARRYNQAALIAQALSRENGIPPTLPDGLRRIRATPVQGHLRPAQRAANVHKAFEVNLRVLDRIKGKCVVLVDDVYTTGATVSECAKTLINAGAARVDILTLAKVVRASKVT